VDTNQILWQCVLGIANSTGSMLVPQAIRILKHLFGLSPVHPPSLPPLPPHAALPPLPPLPAPLSVPQSRAVLEALGKLSPKHVAAIVTKAVPGKEPADLAQRAALYALLLNLTRGARVVATRETASSYVSNRDDVLQSLFDLLGTKCQPGDLVPGMPDWRLVRFLGMGSFGEVWLGRNRQSGMHYAFKFFTQTGAQDWVHREQQSLMKVHNTLGSDPRIVRLINVAVRGQRYPFLMLEYVNGGSLEDWVIEEGGKRPALNKSDVIYDVVRAMAVAHAAGIYHRDLKPGNILLTAPPDPQAKVTDFGLGEIAEPTATAATAAAAAAQAGKPGAAPGGDGSGSKSSGSDLGQVGTSMYRPPEASRPFAEPDLGQYDVFAIGVVWYQLLVERLERPPYDFADRLRDEGQGVDSHTIQIISRCLAGPERRFKDAREVLQAIEYLPGPDVPLPAGCFDVGLLAREYLAAQAR
jgi:hypothetical protein